MTEAAAEPTDHPSPHRAHVRLLWLLYGLIAAPAAWATSQIVNSALAQEACFPGTEPLVAPAFGGVHVLQTVIFLAALVVSASAVVVAFGTWRSTRSEQAGDQHAVLSVGEGRSRFMAFAGLLTSLGFIVGLVFSVPALLLVPVC